jgi:hypothetical protein
VTATAVEFVRESLEPLLLFRIAAVMKGTAPSEPLLIRGSLDATDDVNDSAAVPADEWVEWSRSYVRVVP